MIVIDPHLAFGACDILAVFKLDLPGSLSEVSKAGPSCSPEHIVGNRLVRRLWKEDRQISQVSRLVQDNSLSVINLRMVHCEVDQVDCNAPEPGLL